MSEQKKVPVVDGTSRVDGLTRDPARGEGRSDPRSDARHGSNPLDDSGHGSPPCQAGLTQTDLAAALHVTQAAVARTEMRGDMLLSTLRSSLEAAGAHALKWSNLPTAPVPRSALKRRRASAGVTIRPPDWRSLPGTRDGWLTSLLPGLTFELRLLSAVDQATAVWRRLVLPRTRSSPVLKVVRYPVPVEGGCYGRDHRE